MQTQLDRIERMVLGCELSLGIKALTEGKTTATVYGYPVEMFIKIIEAMQTAGWDGRESTVDGWLRERLGVL